jgi:hypothetical protein
VQGASDVMDGLPIPATHGARSFTLSGWLTSPAWTKVAMPTSLCCAPEDGDQSNGCDYGLSTWTEMLACSVRGLLTLTRGWMLRRELCIPGQAEPDRFHVGKGIRGQYLAWAAGTGDVALMEPTGVGRCMDPPGTSIDLLQPLLRGVTAMRRALVHAPQQPVTRSLGFLSQPRLDPAAQGGHPRRRGTPAPALSPPDVPGGQIWQGPPRARLCSRSSTTVVDRLVSWFYTISFAGGRHHGDDPGLPHVAYCVDRRHGADLEAGADRCGAPDAARLARWDVRRRAGASRRDLLRPVERKHGWPLAEVQGDDTPSGVPQVVGRARGEAEAVREDWRG